MSTKPIHADPVSGCRWRVANRRHPGQPAGGARRPDAVYAYDRQLLSQRVAELRATLPAGIELHYAMKANPMPAVVQHMAGLVDGLDVASGRELRVALDSGMNPANISFAGPGKNQTELTRAVAAGIVINVESPTELQRLAQIGKRSA